MSRRSELPSVGFRLFPCCQGTGTPSCLVPHPGRAASVFQTLIVKVSSCQDKAVTLRVSLELAPNLQLRDFLVLLSRKKPFKAMPQLSLPDYLPPRGQGRGRKRGRLSWQGLFFFPRLPPPEVFFQSDKSLFWLVPKFLWELGPSLPMVERLEAFIFSSRLRSSLLLL